MSRLNLIIESRLSQPIPTSEVALGLVLRDFAAEVLNDLADEMDDQRIGTLTSAAIRYLALQTEQGLRG